MYQTFVKILKNLENSAVARLLLRMDLRIWKELCIQKDFIYWLTVGVELNPYCGFKILLISMW